MHTTFRRGSASTVKPMYTDTSGNHYLAPNDVATIYDIKALYNAGYTGTGQNIVIVGQSTVSNTDLNAFRSAAGLAAKLPEELLVPNTGTAISDADDEGESDRAKCHHPLSLCRKHGRCVRRHGLRNQQQHRADH
jgi:hypothetical protein